MVTIYILECDKGKYYVGKSNNVDKRILDHAKTNGSQWTKLYKPQAIENIIEGCDSFDEDKYTIQYMEKYGINNVRGGSFSKIKLSRYEYGVISKMIKSAGDKCYLCGKNDHFINDCPDKDKDKDKDGDEDNVEINDEDEEDDVIESDDSEDDIIEFDEGSEDDSDEEQSSYSDEDDNKGDVVMWACEHCQRQFKSKYFAMKHASTCKPGTCYKCGISGHWAKDCYVKKRKYNK